MPRKLLVAALTLLILNSEVSAETISRLSLPPGAGLAGYVEAVAAAEEKGINASVSHILEHVPANEAKIIRSVKFRIQKAEWNISGVQSLREGGQRFVDVSIGFLLAVDYMDRAYVEAGLLGQPSPSTDFMSYVAATIRSGYAPIHYCEYLERLHRSASR